MKADQFNLLVRSITASEWRNNQTALDVGAPELCNIHYTAKHLGTPSFISSHKYIREVTARKSRA